MIRETAPAPDPQALALGALGWILSDNDRAARLLALTGLDSEALRAGLGDLAVLGAVLDFLLANERDLVAAAEHLGTDPQVLVRARDSLSREMPA